MSAPVVLTIAKIALLLSVLVLYGVLARSRAQLTRMKGMAGMTQPVPPACPGRKATSCACAGTCGCGPGAYCLCTDCAAAMFQLPGAGGAGSFSTPPVTHGGGGGGGAGGSGGASSGYSSGGWLSGSGGSSAPGAGGGGGGAGLPGGPGLTPAQASLLQKLTGGTGQHMPTPAPARAPRPGIAGIEGFDGRGSSDYAELAVGSVRGLRQWKLPFDAHLHNIMATDDMPSTEALWKPGEEAPLLLGVRSMVWQPGVNEATCRNYADHQPPVEYDKQRGTACGCGFWAYWNVDDQDWHDKLPVFGIVEGTGRVVIGSKGFRCQKARIIALMAAFTIDVGVVPATSGTAMSPYWQHRVDWQQVSAPGQLPGLSREEAAERERELARSRQKADAWLAVCMDLLGLMYPEARIFATLPAMLAAMPPGEVTE